VPEQLLGLLKLCLLALLYLFFARVLWAVWTEVRAVRRTEPGGRPAASGPSAASARGARHAVPGVPRTLVVDQPPARRGARFALSGPELTIGRANGCHVALPEDTFASTVHARVFAKDGAVYVEDLGSTNGTYLNGMRLAAPAVLRPGDQLQVGATVMEAS
jgi:hypothetical protein